MNKKYILFLIISFFVFSSSVFAKNYEVSPQSGSSCSHPDAWYRCSYFDFQVNGTQQMAFTLDLDNDYEDGYYSFDILVMIPYTAHGSTTGPHYSSHDPVIMDQIGGQIGQFQAVGDTENWLDAESYDKVGGGQNYTIYYDNMYDSTTYIVHFDSIQVKNNQVNLMFIIFYSVAGNTDFRFYDNAFISDVGTATVIEQIKETNKTLKDDDMSGGNQSADDFKNNSAFEDTTGIAGIINLPLNFINSLSSSCQPLLLTIPWLDYPLEIPCLGNLLISKVPTIANILRIVINGIIVYRILLGIVDLVHSAKNPDDDRIEVLDL